MGLGGAENVTFPNDFGKTSGPNRAETSWADREAHVGADT
jgi:hypothetical protein